MSLSETELLTEIVSEYLLGQLTGFHRLTQGYVNTSYAITTQDGDATRSYLLRIYRRGIREAEVIFEHSIINHLACKGFALAAKVLPAGSGQTYVRRHPDHPGEPDDEDSIFCAVFDYLNGEDKYTWIRPDCADAEIASSGAALAHFHNAVADLTPLGHRVEPKIIDLLPLIDEGIHARLKRRKDNGFENCLAENHDFILRAIHDVRQEIETPEFNATPHLVIHGDYHPGNLKFDSGRVVGMFDLDWSKVDARTFDIGLALMYFCASWDKTNPADYFRLDRAGVFLNAYQAALAGVDGVGPLDALELKYLPAMAAAGNIYVMEWALRDYYGRAVDPVEYLGYLQHHLMLMRWFDDQTNRLRLERTITETAFPVAAANTNRGGS
jgi:homoserine kinase type II